MASRKEWASQVWSVHARAQGGICPNRGWVSGVFLGGLCHMGPYQKLEYCFLFFRTFCCRYLHLTSTIAAQGIVFGRCCCLRLKLRDFEVKVTGLGVQLAWLLSGVMLGELLNFSEPWYGLELGLPQSLLWESIRLCMQGSSRAQEKCTTELMIIDKNQTPIIYTSLFPLPRALSLLILTF